MDATSGMRRARALSLPPPCLSSSLPSSLSPSLTCINVFAYTLTHIYTHLDVVNVAEFAEKVEQLILGHVAW